MILDNINSDWTLKIEGRKNVGRPSGLGVWIKSQVGKSCSGATKKTSIVLTLIDPSSSAFYPDKDPINEDGVAKRFQDKSEGCTGPNGQGGDEDLCERISQVTLTITSTGQNYLYTCPNGECIIGIGKQ